MPTTATVSRPPRRYPNVRCRYKHLCVTRACLASWTRMGYNDSDVAMFLNATRAIADNQNTALDLRIQNGIDYR